MTYFDTVELLISDMIAQLPSIYAQHVELDVQDAQTTEEFAEYVVQVNVDLAIDIIDRRSCVGLRDFS